MTSMLHYSHGSCMVYSHSNNCNCDTNKGICSNCMSNRNVYNNTCSTCIKTRNSKNYSISHSKSCISHSKNYSISHIKNYSISHSISHSKNYSISHNSHISHNIHNSHNKNYSIRHNKKYSISHNKKYSISHNKNYSDSHSKNYSISNQVCRQANLSNASQPRWTSHALLSKRGVVSRTLTTNNRSVLCVLRCESSSKAGLSRQNLVCCPRTCRSQRLRGLRA